MNLKRTAAVAVSLILIFASLTAEASQSVANALTDTVLMAKRHYVTKEIADGITAERTSDGEYRFLYTTPGGKNYAVTMNLKDWGVWNLGDMRFGTENLEKTIIGGDTDWEYVIRVFNPVSLQSVFTGGNHENESLVGIKMYDGETMEEFSLEAGQSREAKRIVVEEDTQLLLNSAPYANVKRKYTFSGTTVSLDSKIEFTKTMNLVTSYSAMACVNKDFGRYCDFGGSAIAATEPKGYTSGQYVGRVGAMMCSLSGEDKSATLTVGIFNRKDMTDNFSNFEKTFYWDISADYGKLYFSKYELSGLNEVKEGTVWDFGAFWQANIA